MSPDGIEQFRVARDIRNEAADCKRCDDQRDFLLQYSMIRPQSLVPELERLITISLQAPSSAT